MSEALAPYLEGFAALPAMPPAVRAVKEAALQRAAERGFPGARDEAWKYTSVAALEKRGFRPARSDAALDAATLANLLVAGLDGPRAVFVNGRFEADVSRLLQGARVAHAGSADDGLAALLKASPAWESDTFLNLNTALFQDALVVELDAGMKLDAPLELLHVSLPGPQPASHHPRCVMRLGENSRLLLVERYAGVEGAANFTNAVLQVELGEGSELTHVRVQQESQHGFHVGRVLVRQAAGSAYLSHNLQTGALWARLDVAADLLAAAARTELNGIYAVNGRRHVDNHTHIGHLAPHTESRELYRGVLDGNGRAVFNGKVLVAKHAVKTDAAQANHNLILSRGAEIDTKPELEIYADDVKCSHGATIGQLDERQLFYLRSRGIDAESARGLLIGAFAEQLVARLPHPALAAHAHRILGQAVRQLALPESP